jgi:biopolymer transport protein ExbB
VRPAGSGCSGSIAAVDRWGRAIRIEAAPAESARRDVEGRARDRRTEEVSLMVRPRRLLLAVLLVVLTGAVQAQEPPPAPTPASQPPATAKTDRIGVGRASLVQLVRQANPMLWPLVACSVVALGYTLERLIALRRNRVAPREFVDRFVERLASGKLDRERAAELCRANDSPAARVFLRIVHGWGLPSAQIRESVASEAASEVLELRRNVRVLNGTATLAPLLGLLGTVIGMIEAFDALGGRAAAGVGKSEALAHGISLALMATAFGLAIAVVSVAFYYFLINRIDVLIRQLDQDATRVIDLVNGDHGRPAAELRRPLGAPGDLARHEARGY